MDERQGNLALPSGIPIVWPTIIVAIAGFYSYLTYEPALESARPQGDAYERRPPRANVVPSAYARLWQDPLGREYEAVRTEAFRLPRPPIASADEIVVDKLAHEKDHKCVPPPKDAQSPCGRDDQPHDSPNDRGDDPAIAANSKTAETNGDRAQATGDGVTSRRGTSNEVANLLVMAVMLPGGPSADEAELRRRIRYAVESGLTTLYYRPVHSDRLEYFSLRWRRPAFDASKCTHRTNVYDNFRRETIVPFEWFERDVVDSVYDPQPCKEAIYDRGVLVCWLDEDSMMDEPVAVLHTLYKDLAHNDQNIEMAVIGPSNSDMLINLAECDDQFANCPNDANTEKIKQRSRRITLYSPRSTVFPDVLRNTNRGVDDPDDEECCDDGSEPKKPKESTESKDPLTRFLKRPVAFGQVVRAIGTDCALVNALQRELELRGAWPAAGTENDCVVLVTERDTLYGRAFPKMLANGRVRLDYNHQLLVFKYLRGIDGKLPHRGDDASAGGPTGGDSESAGRFAAPAGRGQFDYLQRLEDELVRADRIRRYRNGRGITAIGVVGTDVYDKLLILRALRKKFPRTPFFTTDLDENFDRQSEYDTTRNLIVASHFGLSLHSDLQRDAPPFRDSYQTACFFAVLMALRDGRVNEALGRADVRSRVTPQMPYRRPVPMWEIPEDGKIPTDQLGPLVFEVGRAGSYQLTTTTRMDLYAPSRALELRGGDDPLMARLHPSSPRETLSFSNGGWRYWLMTGAAALALTVVVSTRVGHLPRPLSTFCTCCRGIADGKDVRNNWATVLGVAVGLVVVSVLGIVLAVLIARDSSSPDGEPFAWADGISVWPTTLILLLAIVTGLAMLATAAADMKTNRVRIHDSVVCDPINVAQGKRHAPAAPRPATPSPWWHRPHHLLYIPALSAERAADEDDSKGGSSAEAASAEDILEEYFLLDRGVARLVRSLILTGVFTLFVVMFLRATDTELIGPYRGRLSSFLVYVVRNAAALVLFGLIFFVRDAIILCRRFVTALSKTTSDWPSQDLERGRREWRVRDVRDLRELLMVRVIASRTKVVGKLLYYPFIVLLIIIVAQISVFDNWTWPIPLVLVTVLLLLGLVVEGFMLRKDARRARQRVLDRLQQNLSDAMNGNDARLRQVRHLIDQINAEQRGAFGPIAADPVFQALAIPFGGTGGLILLERLLQ
ncbi:MAG: hypothetical protein R3C10_08700 [Pirellulales bacterium]